MILTGYIKQLQRLDEIETEIIQMNPFPIIFDDKISEKLREIKKYQESIVVQMCGYFDLKVKAKE